MADDTPSYIARCPECRLVIGAAVADISNDRVLRMALSARSQWKRAGLILETMAVKDVRTETWGHADTCVVGQREAKRAARREAREASL